MSRRLCLAALVSLVCLLAVPVAAHAESVSALRQRLETLKSKSAEAGEAFSDAYWELDETEDALAKTRSRLRTTEKKLSKAQRQLNKHASGMYRRDRLEELFFLMGAHSFEQFATRSSFMNRIQLADAQAIVEVKALRRDLALEKRQLAKEQKAREARVKELRGQRDRLIAQLRDVEADFKAVKRRLDAARGGGTSAAGTASAPGPNGMVFPVSGSYYYADTWGASRSGGRRRHQGTDIMAPHGTPVVAVTSGTVSSGTNGLGGNTIWLRGSNGWTFYYAHLQGWAVRSGSVRAGQVIAYVGSTGNASAGAPHLHFQMHPGGGAPVNPYPYLRQME